MSPGRHVQKHSSGVDLELDHLSLPPLVTSQLEMLGPLDGALPLSLALKALETKDQLLGGLGLEKERKG